MIFLLSLPPPTSFSESSESWPVWLKIDSQLMRRRGFHCGETGRCVTAAILVEADRCQTFAAPDVKQLAANRQEYVKGT